MELCTLNSVNGVLEGSNLPRRRSHMQNGSQQGTPRPTTATFYAERAFYARTDALRSQFEEALSVGIPDGGITPLVYAFVPSIQQSLCCSAEAVFESDLLSDLAAKLHASVSERTNCRYLSAPQVRVYVKGCRRGLAVETVDAEWHYMLGLTPPNRNRAARLRVVTEIDPHRRLSSLLTVQRVTEVPLEFNELVLFKANCPYGIEIGRLSMNPMEGATFLDGYAW
jgi:hypothetical protein